MLCFLNLKDYEVHLLGLPKLNHLQTSIFPLLGLLGDEVQN